jgi:hypothetical protein
VLRASVAVVRFDARDGASGSVAMINATKDSVPATLVLALESLDVACHDLDAAVLALPNVRGDDVMATPGLVALLLRVVTARRHVRRLEIEVKAEMRKQLGPSTVS